MGRSPKGPRRHQVETHLDDEQYAQVTALSRDLGVKRCSLVRAALTRFMAHEGELRAAMATDDFRAIARLMPGEVRGE